MQAVFFNTIKCKNGMYVGILFELEDCNLVSYRIEFDAESENYDQAFEKLSSLPMYQYLYRDVPIYFYSQILQVPEVLELYFKLVQILMETVEEVSDRLSEAKTFEEVEEFYEYIRGKCYSEVGANAGFISDTEYILNEYPGLMKRENLMASRIDFIRKLRGYLASGKNILAFIDDVYGREVHDEFINYNGCVEDLIYDHLVLVPNVSGEKFAISNVLKNVI